jgi:hypothetical protein
VDRWFLAYTLLHNPSLVSLRRQGRGEAGGLGKEKEQDIIILEDRGNEEEEDVEGGRRGSGVQRGLQEEWAEGIVMSELHKA